MDPVDTSRTTAGIRDNSFEVLNAKVYTINAHIIMAYQILILYTVIHQV